MAVIVSAVVYVLFSATSKPPPDDLERRFAHGALSRLVVMVERIPQPTEALADANGHTTSLQAYRGKIVLVNLWATWCAPCVSEMPTLGALQRRLGSARFQVVPVSIDGPPDVANAKAELARLSGGSLSFLNDSTRGIAFAAHADDMPTSILYDTQGRELARVVGDTDWNGPEASALINYVVRNNTPH